MADRISLADTLIRKPINPPDLRSDETKEADDRVRRAIARERERCALIADDMRAGLTNGGAINACKAIATAIRRT